MTTREFTRGRHPFYTNQPFRDRSTKLIYVPISTSERYIREDGWSFGVGDEEGYLYSATCRLATDDEAQQVIDDEADEQARIAQDQAFRRLFYTPDSETPPGIITPPPGIQVKYNGGFTIYGGGMEFYIQNEYPWIWLLVNNGHDGDDWSRNNWRTGGAGAVAYRFPLTPERLEFVKGLPGSEIAFMDFDTLRRAAINDIATKVSPSLLGILGEPTDVVAPSAAYWVALPKDVPNKYAADDCEIIGISPDRANVYVYVSADRLRHIDHIALKIPLSNNISTYFLRYEPNERICSLIDSLLPSWASTELVTGRFRNTYRNGCSSAIADNNAQIIREASVWNIPLNRIEFTPDVNLIHAGRFQLWSDVTMTKGRLCDFTHQNRFDQFVALPEATTKPKSLTPAAEEIITAAISAIYHKGRGDYWRANWKSLLTISEIVERKEIKQNISTGFQSSEERTLERLIARHADGHDDILYLCTCDWGCMGEDGDAGTLVFLAHSEADGRDWIKLTQ